MDFLIDAQLAVFFAVLGKASYATPTSGSAHNVLTGRKHAKIKVPIGRKYSGPSTDTTDFIGSHITLSLKQQKI